MNRYMTSNPIVIPDHDVLQANIAQQFGVNPASLQRLLVGFFDCEVHEIKHGIEIYRPSMPFRSSRYIKSSFAEV